MYEEEKFNKKEDLEKNIYNLSTTSRENYKNLDLIKNDLEILKMSAFSEFYENRNRILKNLKKEGYLEKLSKSLIFEKWKQKYCKLIGHKLIYYNSEKSSVLKGIIDFDLVNCFLEISNKKSKFFTFRIQILKSDKIFYFRIQNSKEGIYWVKLINFAIITSKRYKNPKITISIQRNFWKRDRISEENFRRNANMGDIILFRSFGCMAKIQRFFTFANVGISLRFKKIIDHVGFVIREKEEIYLLESLGKRGVALYKWSDFTKYHWNIDYEEMLYRKLNFHRSPEMLDEIARYISVFF